MNDPRWLVPVVLAVPAVAEAQDAARVVADALEVRDEPFDAGYVTNVLRRGDRIEILPDAEAPPGWVAIAPPIGSFCWIDESTIALQGRHQARVIVSSSALRLGRDGARARDRSEQPSSRIPPSGSSIAPR